MRVEAGEWNERKANSKMRWSGGRGRGKKKKEKRDELEVVRK